MRGYALQGGESARAALQVLMLAYGFDVTAGAGTLVFRMRNARAAAEIGPDDLAEGQDLSRPEVLRAPEAELAGRVRVTHIEAGTDYETCTAEAILPDERRPGTTTDSEMSLSLTRAEGRAMAERWLAESRIARDSLRLALPPSRADGLQPGDVIRLAGGASGLGGGRWRIDRIERAGAATIEAVRVEPGVYRPVDTAEDALAPRRFTPPIPVWAEYLDLPLLTGDEVPHAPHLAVTATPWPGSVAAYSAPGEEGGFTLDRLLTRPSVMGVTVTPLNAAASGLRDGGPALRVRVKGGNLRSASEAALLGGANAMAIGDGSPDGWEVFQFATAELVGPGLWDLSGRLRGQAGTDGVMPQVWPVGSKVVLLDGAAVQLTLPASSRGQLRVWRVGPALRGVDDPSYRQRALAFSGVGLRPYAPCHVRLSSAHELSWVRRTRIDGDGWDGAEVPLGEAREAYRVRLVRAGTRLAEALVSEPRWAIPQSIWAAATAGGPFEVEVAQLSDAFGPGPAARRTIDV